MRIQQQLHLTLIRNEQAYYSCIAQVLFYLNFPLPPFLGDALPVAPATTPSAVAAASASSPSTAASDALGAAATGSAATASGAADGGTGAAAVSLAPVRPLYICGDSHSMSSAWTRLTVDGQPCILQPKLVTGLKCFHMRPESHFFTKFNLTHVLDTIPRGADVVFVFGEIDCREGLLVAVERARHETVDEGVAATVDIYFAALAAIQAQYGFRIWVHPVSPVLDVTRTVVLKFNAMLKTKLAQRKWPFRLLDFFDGLLHPHTGYNKTYELDGTHLNPLYVPLMEAALNVPAPAAAPVSAGSTPAASATP